MGICNSSTKEDVKVDRERTRGSQQQGGSQQQQQQQRQQQQQQQQQQQDRQPIAPQPLHPAPSQGIPTGSYRDANGIPRSVARDQPIAASYNRDDDGQTYGTSYTNRKTREYDLLNDIVKQTSRNFIDVSARSGVLDEDDLVERGQKYVKNLSDIPASHSAAAAVTTSSFGRYYNSMELPQPSKCIVKRALAPGTSGLGAGLVAHGATTAVSAPVSVDYAALIALLSTAHIAPNDLEFITSSSSVLSSALLDSSPVHDPPLKIVLTFEELLNDK